MAGITKNENKTFLFSLRSLKKCIRLDSKRENNSRDANNKSNVYGNNSTDKSNINNIIK